MDTALPALYRRYFEVYADLPHRSPQYRRALALRYLVYCQEQGYEDPAAFPNGMESDEFDARALHALLVHRPSGRDAGTVRLIRPDPQSPLNSLPIDTLCRDPRLQDQDLLPRSGLAEVSRFAVSKAFRRRLGDAPTPSGIGSAWQPEDQGQRRIPHLSLGLIQALVANSARYGISHWVAEMEPALLRMLRQLGIYFTKLGPVVEYHGRRQPCYATVAPMLERVRSERPEVWALITDEGESRVPEP